MRRRDYGITTAAKNQIGIRKEIWKFGILPAGGISLFPAHILAASCQGGLCGGLWHRSVLQGVIYLGLCILRLICGLVYCVRLRYVVPWQWVYVSGAVRCGRSRALVWRLMLCGAACGDVLVICCQAGGEMMRLDIKER